MKRWSLRIGLGLLGLVFLAGLLALDFVRSFQSSVPAYRGTVDAAALGAPAAILRDRYGVPHIQAASLEDAAFGLGYAHAQDRLWQMELARRFIQGRLAELFGASAVPSDILMRALGLYDAAGEAVKHLSPQSQRVLASYAAGVNTYLAGHKGRWPIQFTLAGDTPPEPWAPADSIAVLKGMAMQLSGNAFGEAARARLVPVLGVKGVEDFFAPFSAAPLPAYLDQIYGTTRTGMADGVPDTTASDNWAVDGAHSVTGKPLLANDPHLGFTMPSIWYLAHLAIPGEDMVGGTLAGVPAIIAGHNRHVAWGETNTGPDTEDLYLEKLNPDNPREYQTPGGFAEFESHADLIHVRFGRDRRVLLRATRHGPVMPDSTALGRAAPEHYVVALSWTALAPDDTSFDAILGIDRAGTAADIKAAGKSFVTPMQNIVYADDAGAGGDIGLMLPGRVPLRSDKNDSLGLVPAPGWDARYDWQGDIPADAMVVTENPPAGHIATANNKVVPDNYRYTLTREWEAPYRWQRIEQLLSATPKHSLDTMRAIQLDTIDNYALILKPRLMAAGPFPPADAAAARLIANWNGAMLGNRPEPLIFAAWARALARRIYADELGRNFDAYWGYRTEFTLRVLDDIDGEGRWCDDRGTPEVEDCASRIRLALHDAVAELSQAYGSDPARWRWSDAHKAEHREPSFGRFPLIGSFFNRSVDMDGGANTLLRADMAFGSDTPYAAIHGAGYRGIYDLADPDRSLFVISTGESGNPFSLHYDDLLPIWAKGGYIPIPISSDAVARATRDRLVLQPVKSTTVP